MAVVVGQVSLSNTDPDEETIPALAVFVHEDYDHTTRFNDIAMIQVKCQDRMQQQQIQMTTFKGTY